MPRNLHSSSGVGGSGQHGNDNENLLPPSQPTPAELLAMLAEGQRALGEAMRTMAENNARGGWHSRQGAEPNQYSDFKDFQDTKPPIFKEAEDPL
jgi:hypothetical protein